MSIAAGEHKDCRVVCSTKLHGSHDAEQQGTAQVPASRGGVSCGLVTLFASSLDSLDNHLLRAVLYARVNRQHLTTQRNQPTGQSHRVRCPASWPTAASSLAFQAAAAASILRGCAALARTGPEVRRQQVGGAHGRACVGLACLLRRYATPFMSCTFHFWPHGRLLRPCCGRCCRGTTHGILSRA